MNKALTCMRGLKSHARAHRAPRLASLWLWAVLMAGCAPWASDEAQRWLLAGDYEQAMSAATSSLKSQPDSAAARAKRLRLDGEIASRLTQQIAQLRAAGQFDQALQVLERARALKLQSLSVADLQNALQADQSAQTELQAANQLAQEGDAAKALSRVQKALVSWPQHRGLLMLERRLSSSVRMRLGSTALPQLQEGPLVTLELRQAPLTAALEVLSRSGGINFVLDRDVRQDAPVSVFIRDARLSDALDLVLGAQALTRRVINSKTVLIFANTPEKRKEHQEVVLRVFNLTHSDAKTVAAMLRSTLRTAEPFVDEKANLVTLRESPEVIALAERLVALHDSADPEVMLEVEILEVSRSRLLNLGINLPSSLTLTPLNASKSSTGLTLNELANLNSNRIGAAVAPLSFNLRRELGEGQVLANPSIRTKNREKAKIMIGDKVPVVTTSSTATGIVGQNISYLDVGLKLEVEPQISPDEEVTLKLALEVSNITKTVDTGNGGTAYQIGTRNVSTTLRLQDGETQLLGGLISKTDSSSAARLPGAGDLPVIGRLFGNQQDSSAQSELVLSITPRIVRSALRPDALQSLVSMGTENSPRMRSAALPPPERQEAKAARSEAGGTNVSTAASTAAQTSGSRPGPVQALLLTPGEVQQGQVLTVTLEINSPTDLRSLPLELQYPAQAFDVLAVQLGDGAAQADRLELTQAVNPIQGKVGINLQSNNPLGFASKGGVVQLQMRAKAAGEHLLTLTHLAPMGLQGPLPLATGLPSVKVKVQAP